MVWEFEQKILRKESSFVSGIHLDFATGTGRILPFFEEATEKQYGLDISGAMLKVAQDKNTNATLVNKDFREDVAELRGVTFDLVTAFRFFPNAEESLREEAMYFISKKLKRGGILIVNNHRSFWSIPYIFLRLVGSQTGAEGMSNADLVKLAQKNNLKIVRHYSMGVVPQSESTSILPWRITRMVEKLIFTIFGQAHLLGYNSVFVFKKY